MSENSPTPQPSSSGDIDLLQIFNYFERITKKIGNLFLKLFSIAQWTIIKIGILFLMIINVLKKYYKSIFISAVIGFLIPYFLDLQSDKIYRSSIVIKQNFQTGKILYNYIRAYSSLADAKDSISLSNELKMPQGLVANLVKFEIVGFKNENTLYEEYYDHIKRLDSTIQRSYSTFVEELNLEESPIQVIAVYSKDINVYNSLSTPIINAINNNKFFVNEKNKKIQIIKDKIEMNKTIINESDSLQKEYFKLLNYYYGRPLDNSNQSTINLNLSNSKDKITTKEYELFLEEKTARAELIRLRSELLDSETIIELQKDFTPPVLVESSYSEYKFLIFIVIVTFVILLCIIKEFGIINFINRYGTKENLFQ